MLGAGLRKQLASNDTNVSIVIAEYPIIRVGTKVELSVTYKLANKGGACPSTLVLAGGNSGAAGIAGAIIGGIYLCIKCGKCQGG